MAQLPPKTIESPQRNPLRQNCNTTVLLIEEEELIRTIIRLALRSRGYTVIAASSASEAMRLWYENPGAVNLAIIDVRLAGGGPNGLELAERFHQINSRVKIILTAEQSTAELSVNPGFRFLQKPYDIGQLCETVRAVMEESVTPPLT